MRKILSVLTVVLLVVTMASCNKAKVTDFRYKMSGGYCYVYKDTVPYDGIIWSKDGKSYKMSVSCGVLKSVEYFDPKGKLFCFASEGKGVVFYNKKKEEINEEQSRELYRDEYWRWDDLKEEFKEVADSLTY